LKRLQALQQHVARMSPFPRKAWIETQQAALRHAGRRRRLSPGRRGLKRRRNLNQRRQQRSPFPRKAWIETRSRLVLVVFDEVAFPPEGVD